MLKNLFIACCVIDLISMLIRLISMLIRRNQRGAHILCEYRLAPGAILHAGTESAGLRVMCSRRC